MPISAMAVSSGCPVRPTNKAASLSRCAGTAGGISPPVMSALTSESFWGWVVVPLAVLGATVWLSAFTRGWLQRRHILDRPGERSSHDTPMPRGGGIALVPVVLFAWIMLALAGLAPSGTLAIAALAAALALISWYDDLGEIAIGWRLTAHLVAATVGVVFLLGPLPVFQGLLPPLLDRLAAILLWAWFINLYNFMDGIDGITCVETVAIGGGIVLVARLAGGRARLPALELAAREHLPRRRRQRAARLRHRLAAALAREPRRVGAGADPAALLSDGRDGHAAAPDRTWRALLAGASLAFLSARACARQRSWRGA